jgi:hypothetical protein
MSLVTGACGEPAARALEKFKPASSKSKPACMNIAALEKILVLPGFEFTATLVSISWTFPRKADSEIEQVAGPKHPGSSG